MEAKAQARYIRVTPQKARRVVDLIRGKQAQEALAVLSFAPQAASEPVFKVVQSAIANARVKAERASEPFDERLLVVQAAYVDEGPTQKRFQPRAQGRAFRINKRSSHITVVVGPRVVAGRSAVTVAAAKVDQAVATKAAAKKTASPAKASKAAPAVDEAAVAKPAAKRTTKKAETPSDEKGSTR